MGQVILLLFIGFVLGTLGNYIVNYTSSPLAQKYRKWRDDQAQKKAMESFKNAEKRIETLGRDLKTITVYIEFPVVLNAVTFKNYALMAIYFTSALISGFSFFIPYGTNPISNKWIIIQVIQVFEASLFVLSVIMIYLSAFKIVTLMDKITYILPNEEKFSKQLAELQGYLDGMEQKGVEVQPR
jgi:hypothetical protein